MNWAMPTSAWHIDVFVEVEAHHPGEIELFLAMQPDQLRVEPERRRTGRQPEHAGRLPAQQFGHDLGARPADGGDIFLNDDAHGESRGRRKGEKEKRRPWSGPSLLYYFTSLLLYSSDILGLGRSFRDDYNAPRTAGEAAFVPPLRVLRASVVSSPAAKRISDAHDRRIESKGRRGQDDHRRQPRRGIGGRREPGPPDRPRSPGPRHAAPGRRPGTARYVDLRRAGQ